MASCILKRCLRSCCFLIMTVTEFLSHPLAIGLVAILVASAVMGLFSSNKHFPVEGRVSLSQPLGLIYIR
jgi:hypothetical protein